jgi:hypothetical protein
MVLYQPHTKQLGPATVMVLYQPYIKQHSPVTVMVLYQLHIKQIGPVISKIVSLASFIYQLSVNLTQNTSIL